ncbi:MAG: glycosyl hydrolase-related protein [Firmicutes bacterium]|nr:glycosyl hydrolase-related protein [Bacillota bacterium]
MELKDNLKFYFSGLTQKLRPVESRMYQKIGTLKAEFAYTDEPVLYEERESLKFSPIKAGDKWSTKQYGCAWFRFRGVIPECAKGQKVAFLISLGGEGLTYGDNGIPVQGVTEKLSFMSAFSYSKGKKLVEFKSEADGGEVIDFWLDAGYNLFLKPTIPVPPARLIQADIVIVNDEIKALNYDLLALSYFQFALPKGSARKLSVASAIKSALSVAKPYTAESVAKARAILKAEYENGEDSPYTVFATGHAHLDLAWLWPIRETRRKAVRTFTNALRNIERYDGFVFGASQPQQFEWIEEDQPEIFEELKSAIASGAIEPQGGMWVECDTNVSGGEALVRQFMYGKRYWKEKFNKDVTICHIPDVFGYNGNLPQIMKKTGVNYFMTCKLSWNEHNKFPYHSFIWQGIDDSSVLAHLPPEGYNSDLDSHAVLKALNEYKEKDVTDCYTILYGMGDGGGGPGETHLEFAKRGNILKGAPKVEMAPTTETFKRLEKFRDKLNEYKGELYFEKHQGTYTTQAKTKNFNRRLEFMLHNTEFLFVATGAEYPKAEIEKIWKEVLLYQFHDILPGSSIARVYEEAEARYQKLENELTALQTKALAGLVKENNLTAINFTSYNVNEIVNVNGKHYTASLKPYSAGKLQEFEGDLKVKAGENFIENEFLIAKFGKNGEIVSLIEKESGKEFAGEFLNSLNVHYDKKLFYNAWDIDINYTKYAPKKFKLIDFEVDEVKGVRKNFYSYNKSEIVQTVEIGAGKPFVEFTTTVNWQETHKMLRAEFKPAVFSDTVSCDIQFGNLKRSTKDETSIEKAQFEICAHKWIDVSDNGFGVSVLSDSKYGWRVKNGLISLNLLRGTMHPAVDADKGVQTFRYAVYPHKGGFNEAETARHSYLFNNPLLISENGAEFSSVASTDKTNISIETIKPAESGKGIVIRLYEDAGIKTETALTVLKQYTNAQETDMLENVIGKCDIKKLSFEPYEIKTILLTAGGKQQAPATEASATETE